MTKIETTRCLSCGAPLSVEAVNSRSPKCLNCGCVMQVLNGTLDFAIPFLLNDPNLNYDVKRTALKSVLDKYLEYELNYIGNIEFNKQELSKETKYYAKLPKEPIYYVFDKNPPLSGGKGLPPWIILGCLMPFILPKITATILSKSLQIEIDLFITRKFGTGCTTGLMYLGFCFLLSFLIIEIIKIIVRIPFKKHKFRIKKENEKLLRLHEIAVASAIEEAIPIKARKDYELKNEIQNLESLLKGIRIDIQDVREKLNAIV